MKPSKKLLTLIKTPIFSVKLNFFEKNCCRKKIIGRFRERYACKNAQDRFFVVWIVSLGYFSDSLKNLGASGQFFLSIFFFKKKSKNVKFIFKGYY